MEIKEFFQHREFLLDEAKNEDGFISETSFLNICIPDLYETKLIDTDDWDEGYCSIDNNQLKINGYIINESGERLQVFILNEDSIDLAKEEKELLISQKSYYEKQFTRATGFIKKAIKKHDDVQDSSSVKVLTSLLSSSEGIEQIDVIEFFLISATATIESRGESPQPKNIDFEDDSIKVSFTKDRNKIDKEIVLIKRLVDLNFFYNVTISQGNREPLTIRFCESPFNQPIKCIQAASEEKFDSYLCVLPAETLAELYKRYSTRMLEKNVRSFLQLKGVNKGIQETIKKSPEKFIAYNNGLTITATGQEVINENDNIYLKSLTDFQIVNGGQTTATIYFSKKAGLSINQVRVMAKINVAKNATEEELDDLIASISTYSNAQSRVSKVDLRSRSSQLIKLKSLSESIVTPTGKKWFFERAKGEFSTLIRKSPQHKNKINKDYPKERRFTKEELAKYYISWGVMPYTVKKGGEKVFRYFIEEIMGEGKAKKPIEINRSFYEDLIARILLFRSLEKIYGLGSNAIGQIRSAVVPYSIAAIYKHVNDNKSGNSFDLLKLWKSETFPDDLGTYFKELMNLMNELIKKYSKSDDYGEYSKKEDLWDDISDSKELKSFMTSNNTSKIISRYSLSKVDSKEREKKKLNPIEIDFKYLQDIVMIYGRSDKFYKKILEDRWDVLKNSERIKIEQIIIATHKLQDLQPQHVSFGRELLDSLRISNPLLFDLKEFKEDLSFRNALDLIVRVYNKAINNGISIKSEFSVLTELAKKKNAKKASVYEEIGTRLSKGEHLGIMQLKEVYDSMELIKSVLKEYTD